MKRSFSICKSISVIHPLQSEELKPHDFLNTFRKSFDKIQCPIMSPAQSCYKEKNLNTKAFYDKLIANFVFNGEKMKAFCKIRNMTRMPTHTTFI